MKYIYIILSILTVILITSCEDNKDFSSLHNLTEEEIAEIARQDSIENAQKNKIDADLILEYSIDITMSSNSYDGGSLEIDLDQIAEKFEITKEELLAGIAGEDDAPEVKGFAINGSTHTDYSSASNTNGAWGHWWDVNGDVVDWGDNAMIYAEFDTDNGVFNIGQYPAHLTDGQSISVIEALKYNDIRVAVVITVNAKAKEEISATVVNTQELNINIYPRLGYDSDPLQFNLTQTLSDLGISSMDEVDFIAVNDDGSYNQEPTDGNRFWYNTEGYAGTYGDDGILYVDYGEYSDDKVSIGQYPGYLTEDETLVVQYGLLANNKIEMLKISIAVVAYDDPETPATGDPEELTTDIELSKTYSDDYATVTADIKEIMRNAFKKTTYQIGRAIISGDLKLYQGEVSETDPTYTADAPGYWLNSDGNADAWANSMVWCSIGYSETELYLYGGNHPTNATTGDTVNTKLIATYNGGSVTFNITFNVK